MQVSWTNCERKNMEKGTKDKNRATYKMCRPIVLYSGLILANAFQAFAHQMHTRERRALADVINATDYDLYYQHLCNIRVQNIPNGGERQCTGFLVEYKRKPFLMTAAHCFRDMVKRPPHPSIPPDYFDLLLSCGTSNAFQLRNSLCHN